MPKSTAAVTAAADGHVVPNGLPAAAETAPTADL